MARPRSEPKTPVTPEPVAVPAPEEVPADIAERERIHRDFDLSEAAPPDVAEIAPEPEPVEVPEPAPVEPVAPVRRSDGGHGAVVGRGQGPRVVGRQGDARRLGGRVSRFDAYVESVTTLDTATETVGKLLVASRTAGSIEEREAARTLLLRAVDVADEAGVASQKALHQWADEVRAEVARDRMRGEALVVSRVRIPIDA